MALTVDVDVDIDANLSGKTMRGVRRYLEAGADRGFAEYIDRMPVDRGTMQNNSFSPVWDGDQLVYGTRNTPYVRAQDQGTGPYVPPIQPLLEWGERVLGSEGAGAAVWQKIREEGIEGKHFSRDAIEAQTRWYQTHDAAEYIERELR